MRRTMDALIPWALALMLAWQPTGRSRYRGAVETNVEAQARYEAIARAALTVAFDPEEAPVLGSRERTAVLLLSVAYFESGFRRDIDLGGEEKDGEWEWFPLARGDGGRSYCMMQMQIGQGETEQGWTGRELVGDRVKCFRAGLAHMRRSVNACRALPREDWLSAYTTGECSRGEYASQRRILKALAAKLTGNVAR